MRAPADRGRLGDAGSERGPALGAGSTPSAMDAVEWWNADWRMESFSAPLPSAPNIRFRVPAKPLRFEHRGAHEDLSFP